MWGTITYIYNNFYNKILLILIIISILSILLIILNKFIFKFLNNKSILQYRTFNRGLETYEFGTQSIGLITTVSNNQFIILTILFLLFDIELIFIIPWVINITYL